MALVILLEDGSALQHSQLSSVGWSSLGQQQEEGLARALGARLPALAAAGTALDGCCRHSPGRLRPPEHAAGGAAGPALHMSVLQHMVTWSMQDLQCAAWLTQSGKPCCMPLHLRSPDMRCGMAPRLQQHLHAPWACMAKRMRIWLYQCCDCPADSVCACWLPLPCRWCSRCTP